MRRFLVSRLGLVLTCFAAILVLEFNAGSAKDPLVTALLGSLAPFSLILLLYFSISTLVEAFISNERPYAGVSQFLSKSLARGPIFLLGLALVYWALSNYGDTVIAWWREDPAQVFVSLVAAAIVLALGLFAGLIGNGARSFGASAENRAMGSIVSGAAVTLSSRDLSVAAAHEAGHALLHAALVPVPTDLRISLTSVGGSEGALAYVVAGTRENRLSTKGFAHWEMLTFLAGTAAESFAFKHISMGSTSDHRRWLGVAINYLTCFGDEVFHVDVTSDNEIAYNRARLGELREEHLRQLGEFFAMNAGVFHELRERLIKQHKLVHEEVKDLFDRVVFPEDFPRPSLSAEALETI